MDAARTEKWKKNRLASFRNVCLAQVILPFHPTSMTLLSKTVKINFQEPKRTNKYLKETKMWHLKLVRSLDKDDQLTSFCFLSTAVHAAGWIIHFNLKSAKKKVLNSIGIRCPEDIFGWFFLCFFFFLICISSSLCNVVVLIRVVFVSLHIVSVNERFNPLFQVSRLQEKMRLVKQLVIWMPIYFI